MIVDSGRMSFLQILKGLEADHQDSESSSGSLRGAASRYRTCQDIATQMARYLARLSEDYQLPFGSRQQRAR